MDKLFLRGTEMKRVTLCLLAQAGLSVALLIGATDAGAAAINVPNLLCSGRNDHAPVYLFQAANGALSRMEVTATADQRYVASYINVSPDALLAECANGTSMAALPVPQVQGLKDGVPSQSSLPYSFTIMTSTTIACKYGQPPPECRRDLWGNFWVPGSMPSSDNAHIVQYDLAQSGFNNSASSTHFVNSLVTVSNSSFATDFQGKGMIIGVASACGDAYSSIVETWQIGNVVGTRPVANEVIPDPIASTEEWSLTFTNVSSVTQP